MPAVAEMKFADFMDLLLAVLYRIEQEQGGAGEYFDLNRLASLFTKKVPPPWVFDAAKVIESRGLARCVFTFGAIYAQLTGEGRLYVEQEKANIIKEFHHIPSAYVNLGAVEQVAAPSAAARGKPETIEQERLPVFSLLDKIEIGVKQDGSLTEQEKEELAADLQAIRGQLRKREPNRTVLAALLEPFARVPSVSSLVANLVQIINYS